MVGVLDRTKLLITLSEIKETKEEEGTSLLKVHHSHPKPLS
jgi:hypothetical protein